MTSRDLGETFHAKPECFAEQRTNQLVLRVASAMILIGTLSAGLWPFHAPKNAIGRIGGGGLDFGRHGSMLSAQPFQPANLSDDAGCTLEIWLEPAAIKKAGTILTIYNPGNFAVLLGLRQSLSDLELGRGDTKRPQHFKYNRVYADDVFSSLGPVLITITSGVSGTAVYSNKNLVKHSPRFRFYARDLAGQLIFGNSPSTTDSWSGMLKGLAIYSRELSVSEVKQHYSNWMDHALIPEHDAVALYTFSEGTGTVVQNLVDSATNLVIPQRFVVPNKPFLERPWDEFYPGWNYWENIAVNVFGFVPFGFSLCALLYTNQNVRRPVLSAIALGFAVSLTIEVLQGFLPTRDSGMTDLFTNAFGTGLGASAYVGAVLWYRARRATAQRPSEMSQSNLSRLAAGTTDTQNHSSLVDHC